MKGGLGVERRQEEFFKLSINSSGTPPVSKLSVFRMKDI